MMAAGPIVYYFIVKRATGNIVKYVMRNTVPQPTSSQYFVLADSTNLIIYHRLLSEGKDPIHIDDVKYPDYSAASSVADVKQTQEVVEPTLEAISPEVI